MQNDKNEVKAENDYDRMTSFMFGNRRFSDTKHKDDFNSPSEKSQSHEITESNQHGPFHRNTERGNDWLFGFNQKTQRGNRNRKLSPYERILDQVDYDLLMDTIDSGMKSYQSIKPLFSGASPFLQKFTKKFQSK